MRTVAITGVVFAVIAGAAVYAYHTLTQGAPPPPAPEFQDTGETLATQIDFEKLAQTDPVKLLAECLMRYQREVKSGIHCTLEKQERVKGQPPHPEMPPVEVIDLWVRGDVPDPHTHQTAIEVLMKWQSGARKVLGSEITGTLFSEKPEAENGLGGKVVTWRPKAFGLKLGPPMLPNSKPAQEQSRYCIRDAGLYRTMLRTYEAWKARQDVGELKFDYLGKKFSDKTASECLMIRRYCPRIEIDAFEIGGTARSDPKVVAAEGFTDVTIFIDPQLWLQVGTELYRTEPDGTRVLVGAYYFRDITLNPTFVPETFTTEWLKK